MRIRTLQYLLACIFFSFINTSAQTHGTSLSGYIKDAAGKPIDAANVMLLDSSAKTLVQAILTNAEGYYNIENVIAGTYSIHIIHPVFSDYRKDSIIVAYQPIVYPQITLIPIKKLGGITITAQKPLIEIHADKLVVNVDNSIVNTGSTVLEVLGRSPGVTVDQSDNIRLKGRTGTTIMMDGKTIPIHGADLASVLRAMPAASIDKIEIISNPGARYDAAGSGGIINIKTKRDKRMGLNGTLNTSYGQGVYHKGNIGFNASYRTKKVSINSGYNYGNRTNLNNLAILREFYNPDGSVRVRYDQKGQTIYPVRNHTGNLSVDYYLSSKTTIGFTATADRSHYDPKGDNFARVDSNNTYTYFGTSSRSQDKWYNYSTNAYLKHTFDSSGRMLSVDVDYARYWNTTIQRYTNRYYTMQGDMLIPDYLLLGNLAGITQIRSIKGDYTHPLKNGMRFDAGFKSSLVTANNQLYFYDQSSGSNVFDSTKSNHFIYDENINALYINTAKDGGQWSYQLGLRAEQTIAHGNQVTTKSTFERNYIQLFPSLALQRHLNKDHDLGITLSRRIDRPTYRQLNPFRFFLDPTNSRMGNPYLNPTRTYSAELSHIYKQRFVSTFTYSIATDVIIETLQADTLYPNRSINSDKNIGRNNYYAYSGSYQFKIAKWWNNITNIIAYYTQYSGTLSNTRINKQGMAFECNITNTFTLSKDISAELSGYYQSPQVWGNYDLLAVSSINLGLQKNFWNKKATIKLSYNDILWKSGPTATTRLNDFMEKFIAIRDSRIFMIAATYRFGQAQQSSRRHNSGAEDEKRRAGG